jgi:Arc/MetJ-type ribon-helix-helix transcriptional regulator
MRPYMSRDDLVRFARRDWAAVAAAKEAQWLRQKAAMSPADGLEMSDVMRRYARAISPEWPTQADREADLSVHHRVGQALRAVTRTSG